MSTSVKYGALFREAGEDARRDYYRLHPNLMTEGYWLIRLKKGAPLVPARTYWSWSEPGNPENLLDRWPLPYLAAEILGQVADPTDIFIAPDRRPLRPLKRGSIELSVEEHYNFLLADVQHAKEHRPDDPLSKPLQRVDLTKSPLLF